MVALCRLMNLKMQSSDTAAAEAAIERVGGWFRVCVDRQEDRHVEDLMNACTGKRFPILASPRITLT